MPALPPIEYPIIELLKSRQRSITIRVASSLPLPSKPRPYPHPVPRHPFPFPDPVSPPRLSVAASSEATKSSTISNSTILPPFSKPKPNPHKSHIPSRAFSPPYKKHRVHDPDSPPKFKVKTKASHDRPSSQSKFFLLLYFPFRANFHLLSSSS